MNQNNKKSLSKGFCKPSTARIFVSWFLEVLHQESWCIFFTILEEDYVDGFLQHLNNQQPTIRFIMEIKKYNTIPFLYTSVSRDSLIVFSPPVCIESSRTLTNT